MQDSLLELGFPSLQRSKPAPWGQQNTADSTGSFGTVAGQPVVAFVHHHASSRVGDRPLAKVAEPEGSSKIVTFATHKESFFLHLSVRAGTTIAPGWQRFEKLVKGRQSLSGGEGLQELVRVVHPKVTSGTSGTQRATWRWRTTETEHHEACRRFLPKVAMRHAACDSSRSVQFELSYLMKLPNTPDVISWPS